MIRRILTFFGCHSGPQISATDFRCAWCDRLIESRR